MDFENQFSRPMIQALGSRMAILKMESVCDKPDGKFQQGFELGFEEAFNFIREFGHADEIIKRLDIEKKLKRAAEHAKDTEESKDGWAAVRDEKIEQNLQASMDAARVPDLRAAPVNVSAKSIADSPDIPKEASASDSVDPEKYQVGVFVRTWLLKHCPMVLDRSRIHDSKGFDKTELSKLGLHESDYLDLMTSTFDKFGQKGDCFADYIMRYLHTVGELVTYFKNHTL